MNRTITKAKSLSRQRGDGFQHANRALMAAIIRVAFLDAQGSVKNVTGKHFFSAWEFIESEACVEMCDFLGVPTRVRIETISATRELALERRGWFVRPKEKKHG